MTIYQGLFTAIPTPFRNGNLDEEAIKRIVKFQEDEGVHGIVVAGTTGEAPTLENDEHLLAIEIAVKSAKKMKVIAGVGSNSTKQAVFLTKEAQKLGADGIMAVTPYYNKPSSEGLRAHFTEIAKATDLEIMLYNVPSRTGINMSIEDIYKLSLIDNITGIKDATVDLQRPLEIRAKVAKNFGILSGEDGTCLGFLAQGGDGLVSVASNVVPKICLRMINDFRHGDISQALEAHKILLPLYKALFADTNPIPVKYAVSLLGLCTEDMRLPLGQLSKENKSELKQVMESLGL